jgi:hypothetical protein
MRVLIAEGNQIGRVLMEYMLINEFQIRNIEFASHGLEAS